jgi:hypothetical protein
MNITITCKYARYSEKVQVLDKREVARQQKHGHEEGGASGNTLHVVDERVQVVHGDGRCV